MVQAATTERWLQEHLKSENHLIVRCFTSMHKFLLLYQAIPVNIHLVEQHLGLLTPIRDAQHVIDRLQNTKEHPRCRAGKSCTRCVRTFCPESRTFEDILGLRSGTFVAILEQELRIGNSRLRMRMSIDH